MSKLKREKEIRIKQEALNFLIKNRKAEEAIAKEHKKAIAKHKKTNFPFNWIYCRRIGVLIINVERRITEYLKAEAGIREGSYEPAIGLLEQIADEVENMPQELNNSSLLFFFNNPNGLVRKSREIKENLISLQGLI